MLLGGANADLGGFGLVLGVWGNLYRNNSHLEDSAWRQPQAKRQKVVGSQRGNNSACNVAHCSHALYLVLTATCVFGSHQPFGFWATF